MKNKYTFKLLEGKRVYSGLNRNEIFSSMLELTKNTSLIHLMETFSALLGKLFDGHYYLAHNIVFRKGGKFAFQGEIMVLTRIELMGFLKKTIEINDLRDFLIPPVFDGSPSYVVSVNDGSFYFFK
jgi:hypothetical protein